MSDIEIRQLTPDHFDELVAIRRFAFLDDTDYDDSELRERLQRRMTTMVGGFLGDELTVAGAMLPFRMHFGGATRPVGGLASVVSAAEHRRKGYVREMLRHMLKELHDDGGGWCLEYPFDPRYYAKFGWQTIPNGLHVEAPPEQFMIRGHTSSGRRVSPDDEEGVARVREIYGEWARRFNFTMTRDGNARDDWSNLLLGSPWSRPKRNRFTYLFDDAYTVVQLERDDDKGQVAYAIDYAWTSDAGRREAFGFWGNLAGQVDLVHVQLPSREPTLLDLTPFLVKQPHPIQARIVDVPSALSGAPVPAGTDAVFAVTDEFCPWNTGTYRLSETDGLSRVERTDAEPDASLDIRELTLFTADQSAALYPTAGSARSLRRTLAALSSRPSYMPLSDYF